MTKTSNNFSILNKDLVINGNVTVNGKFVINGILKGSLLGDTVIIAKSGEVFGETIVNKMVIAGKFDGEIIVKEELVILPSGICNGKVACKNIVLNPGGILNAQVNCSPDQDL